MTEASKHPLVEPNILLLLSFEIIPNIALSNGRRSGKDEIKSSSVRYAYCAPGWSGRDHVYSPRQFKAPLMNL